MSLIRGRNLKRRLTQPLDEWWDRRLRVQTFGYHAGSGQPGDHEWFMHYEPSPYSQVFQNLKQAGLTSNDVVTDLGSGLGRVVFAAAWAGARRAEGVELIPALTEAAEANYARSNLKDHDIRFMCSDARKHDFSETSVVYMFHPFGHAIVEEVLQKVRSDRKKLQNPRPLRVIYVNPVANNVLEDSGWFRHITTNPAKPRKLSNVGLYDVSFWQSTD